MLIDDASARAREQAIASRWAASHDQVTDTAKAVATGRLEIANTADEIKRRQARLDDRGIGLESIIGTDDSLWLSFFSAGLTASRPIGRIVEVAPGAPPTPVATGVLIGASLLLTNHHVIGTADDASGMGVQFGYEYDDRGVELVAQLYPLAPETAFHTDTELDFTVVGVGPVNGAAPGSTYGTIKLIGATGKALKAENLNVIHHPNGDRKKVSIRENRLVAEDDLWLRYTSDTQHGSSGSGVFNDQWEMVALHHGGFARRDAAGNRLTRTGLVWTEDMGEDQIDFVANEGARVSRIVGALQTAQLDPPTRVAVDAALANGEPA
jgi:V8-like Glu-specific endopeptidase